MDMLNLVETKKAECAKRAARLRAQLEAVEEELRALKITADTLARLSQSPVSESASPKSSSYSAVWNVLGDTAEHGKTPREVHESLAAIGVTNISPDNVRTILSRYKDRFVSLDGRYWRNYAQPETEAQGDD